MLLTKNLTRNAVEELSRRLDEPEWLKEIRLEAFEKFCSLPLPNFRYGISIRMDFSGLDFDAIDPLGGKNDVDGVMDLHTAIKEKPDLVKKYLMKSFDAGENKFAALHAAFWNSGVFVHVPKKADVTVRISKKARNDVIEHTLVVADELSNLTIIEEMTSQNEGQSFRSGVVEVFAENGAKVKFASVQDYDKKVYNFDTKIVTIGKDADMKWYDFCFGSRFVRSSIINNLNGQGGSTKNVGLFFGNEEQQYDLAMEAYHNASDTASDMITKGALNDSAKTIYRGLVKIEKDSQRCNGYQKEDVVLLSEKAESDSIPKLEIENNEVRCSHGATVGQIDQEKVFYLRSRGLNEKLAKKLVVSGFFEPVVQLIEYEPLEQKVRAKIEEWL